MVHFAYGMRGCLACMGWENQKRDIERWMPGLMPGDFVVSELNPLTYSRENV